MRYDYDDYEIDRGQVFIKKDDKIISAVDLNRIIEDWLKGE